MKGVIIVIVSVLFISSCSTQTKEKELPNYFCNENLERYFAGNDRLPIININPNDSFGVIRKSVDSISNSHKGYDISFKSTFNIDSNSKPITLKTFIRNYHLDRKDAPSFMNKRSVFEIRLNSVGQMLIEAELGDTQTLRKLLYQNILNYGKDPNYSDHPKYVVISLQWDKAVKQEYYNNTLKAIIDTYIDALNPISIASYGKPLCELTVNETRSLSQSIPFKLFLNFPETIPRYLIPQPPPIIEDEFISDFQE